jgi:hypothetical protein
MALLFGLIGALALDADPLPDARPVPLRRSA